MTELEALKTAIKKAGSQTKLADAVGVKQQSVSYWRSKLKKVPADYVPAVERATGISRHALRPDIFGAAA